MSNNHHLFTSESVSEGHPDKLCDQISDAVLDAYLAVDPESRVACETVTKTGMLLLAGEITSKHRVDYDSLVRDVVRKVGYTDTAFGLDADSAAVLTNISQQSPDIAQGVNENEGAHLEQGAGDQGLMFGFACNETPELMPLPISLSHKIMEELARLRHERKVNFLRPDSKSQVTVRYENGKPVGVDTVVVSTQHGPEVGHDTLSEFVIEEVIKKVVPDMYLKPTTRFLINPTGKFVMGGPQADAGLTGRKIIVDTYGGYSRHGGGAFSGKDPSKVDRSAAYAGRYVAKNIVAAGLATKCEIQVAYAIGVAEPVSILVDTFGTAKVPEQAIAEKVREVFSFAPKSLIKSLDLLKPIYQKTASYGHFGREPGKDGSFSWERTDLAAKLKGLL
ncbi:MAG TPA: methionine adenosyltransferase [Oligoflexia bacterium]|nr:methionine adenosyltransferase [Oligoflexia bacterium]HMP48879.1 methionine adenosyltransferase [Oligoflexia bacterium]